MARQPDSDERLVLRGCSVAEKGRRVYVRELARYLDHPLGQIKRFLRNRGVLHWARLGTGHKPVPWVSEAVALRVIAHFRAIQGEVYLQGKDYCLLRERQRAREARQQARRAARKALGSREESEHGER